jgi:hypothetical protein
VSGDAPPAIPRQRWRVGTRAQSDRADPQGHQGAARVRVRPRPRGPREAVGLLHRGIRPPRARPTQGHQARRGAAGPSNDPKGDREVAQPPLETMRRGGRPRPAGHDTPSGQRPGRPVDQRLEPAGLLHRHRSSPDPMRTRREDQSTAAGLKPDAQPQSPTVRGQNTTPAQNRHTSRKPEAKSLVAHTAGIGNPGPKAGACRCAGPSKQAHAHHRGRGRPLSR